MKKLTPKNEALAFRIWGFAKPAAWDVTLKEIADELAESPARVRAVAQIKGWLPRLRSASAPRSAFGSVRDKAPLTLHRVKELSETGL